MTLLIIETSLTLYQIFSAYVTSVVWIRIIFILINQSYSIIVLFQDPSSLGSCSSPTISRLCCGPWPPGLPAAGGHVPHGPQCPPSWVWGTYQAALLHPQTTGEGWEGVGCVWGGESQDGDGGHMLGVQCLAQVANKMFSSLNTFIINIWVVWKLCMTFQYRQILGCRLQVTDCKL